MNVFIECLICQQTFDQSVFLPCGHSMCKKHELTTDKEITCPKCLKVYQIPEEDGFPTNRLTESLIRLNFVQLDLGAEHRAVVKSSENTFQ